MKAAPVRGLLGPIRASRTLWLLAALFVGSLILRAGYMVAGIGADAPLAGDAPHYHSVAVSFLNGDGWRIPDGPLSYRAPFLSFQLWLVYLFTDPSHAAARWTIVVVSSALAPLLFLVSRRLSGGRTDVALVTAGAWLLYPPSIWYAARVLTESTTALLVVAMLGTFLWAAKSRSAFPALLTGTLWALVALNRPVYLLVPPVLLLTQVALSRFGPVDWQWRWRTWALGIAAFMAVMTPWTIRNYVEHGVFMPTTSALGKILIITNGDLSDPLIRSGKYNKDLNIVADGLTEVESDRARRRAALDENKANWRLLPVPILNRAKNFWTTRPDPYDPNWTRNDWIMLITWGPTLVLFVASSFSRSWRRYWPALVLVLYAFVTTLPFWGTQRFRYPVDPIIITGAVIGLFEVARWLLSEAQRRGFQVGETIRARLPRT